MANITIPIKNPDFRAGSGVGIFISFERLDLLLHSTGELKPDEEISGAVISDSGIQYYIQKKEE